MLDVETRAIEHLIDHARDERVDRANLALHERGWECEPVGVFHHLAVYPRAGEPLMLSWRGPRLTAHAHPILIKRLPIGIQAEREWPQQRELDLPRRFR